MKKILALLLSMTTVAVMSVAAFADTPDSTDQNLTAGISFGIDEDSGKHLGDPLEPGHTYNFPVFITDEQGNTEKLNDEHLERHNLSATLKTGKSSMESFTLEDLEGGYCLQAVTTPSWTAKSSTVSYLVKYATKNSGKTIYSENITFTVGYETLSDDAITKDGPIIVDPQTPIITEKQFKNINKLYGNKNKVTFANDDWSYTVQVNDQKNINLLNNNYDIPELLDKFPNNAFKFVSFPAGPVFNSTGTLTIDVTNEENYFDNFYVYRYYQGVLYFIDAAYDLADGTVSFNTDHLGRFVITDQKIADGTIVESGFTNTGTSNTPNNTPANINNTSTSVKPNPSTGSSDFTGIVTTIAILAIASAVISIKKK